MRVHIVCGVGNRERILPRLAAPLRDELGWSMGSSPDRRADINYYFPYLELRRRKPVGPSAGLFTHREDVQPAKVEIWEHVAGQVDLRVSWPNRYADELDQYGTTVAIMPPLDRDHFTPSTDRLRVPPSHPRAGVSGFVYTGGRKGEQLLKSALTSPEGQAWEWGAIGRGWPVPTKMLPYSQLPVFYRSLDLFVCTSTIEGIPYGPLEALACGVPIVIPRGVGMMDSLPPDGLCVFRYEAGDLKTFREALASAHELATSTLPDREMLRSYTEGFTAEGWVSGHQVAFESLGQGSQEERTAKSQKAQESTQGIYAVAYGDPARECVRDLIASVRLHMPDTPIAVASDRPVVEADIWVEYPDADLGGRTAKTKMYDLAPANWERVLYLDADTILTKPINFLFDVLRDGWELVCTKDVANYELIHSLWRRDSQEHKLGWEAIGSDRALQLAGGVFGFRRCDNVATFLPAWYEEWLRMARRDQGALLRSLYSHPCRILVLGNEWNTFDGNICKDTVSEGITHRRGGPARRRSGWPGGRMDDPRAWEGTNRRYHRNGAQGREGVQLGKGVQGVRPFHREAFLTIKYIGPKASRRITGRSGTRYNFIRGEAKRVEAQDRLAAWMIDQERSAWEVSDMECIVCHAPNGACTGVGEPTVEETGMAERDGDTTINMPRQRSRRGTTGYVGEKEGKVKVYDRRQPGTGGTLPVETTLEQRLANLSDEQLKAHGLQRVDDPASEEGDKKEAKEPVQDKRRKVPASSKAAED